MVQSACAGTVSVAMLKKLPTHDYIPRVNAGGNYCGHNPASPRLVSEMHPYAPSVLQNWGATSTDDMGHNRKAAWFYDVTEKLNLFYRYPKTIPALGLIYKEDYASRRHRSEAREADVALLTALVHHMELASTNWHEGFNRVGMPTKDGFQYFDKKFWKLKTGLSDSRLKRSFSRLEKAGFVTREKRWVERDDGRFKGLATMTLIDHSLFRILDMMDGLRDAAHFAVQKLQAAADKLMIGVGKMLACAVAALRKPEKKPKPKKVNPEDFPMDDPRHWDAKLKTQAAHNAFREKYFAIFIEQGSADGAASVYRRAYEYARRI